MDIRDLVADELSAVRRRSLDLLEPLREEDLRRQVSPIMSPLVWDLAHVGNYEELWLLREVTGASPLDASLDPLYDAFRHPRKNRPALPLLSPDTARRYIAEVRGRVLDSLERLSIDDSPARPLTRQGFVYGMVIQPEHMHDETMLATLQLMEEGAYHPVSTPPPPGQAPATAEVWVPGGPFIMGTDDVGWAYDNEHPAHEVDVAMRASDRATPVLAPRPGRVVGTDPFRPARGPADGRARAARVVARGRRLRPLGGQAPAHRGGVGEGGGVGTRRPRPQVSLG